MPVRRIAFEVPGAASRTWAKSSPRREAARRVGAVAAGRSGRHLPRVGDHLRRFGRGRGFAFLQALELVAGAEQGEAVAESVEGVAGP
jgi:hypothetical protein